MTRPSIDRYLMDLALVAARRSTCVRRSVGCVLADARGRVLSIGYNGVASGRAHCNDEATQKHIFYGPPSKYSTADLRKRVMNDYNIKPAQMLHPHLEVHGGRDTVLVFGYLEHVCEGHDLPPGQDSCEAVHAEQNAILQCARPDDIATAYVTLAPCKACLKLLLNTGCRRLVFAERLDDMSHLAMWPEPREVFWLTETDLERYSLSS